MTALPAEPVPFTVPESFRDLLCDEIAAARDAVAANELLGQHQLAEWWQWRVRDLELYLDALRFAVVPAEQEPSDEPLDPW
jgi:hypothetical protein